ncbi:hypothetical protein LX59_01577 [Azomonas agilis]|uniref:Replication initiation factor n=1 Tax=Azomonas agilis TaxID=116849 RepID=A0A562IL16_9GAMM|nr:replication initiation factor domain-containing protein [Azomonas agilis]TWH71294.1 hypothetical protein LX59_01577 [Azomonas agilis]
MKKAVHQQRMHLTEDGDFQPSAKGRLFFDPSKPVFTDLSDVRLLRCAVDTVRQLYRGLLRPEVLALFESTEPVEFAGFEWSPGRVSRDSGYQYRLQNAQLGFILLLKNFNVSADVIGPHLKIEVSPHALDRVDPADLQQQMDAFAAEALQCVEVNQAAVHLALDVQGWKPSADLVAHMHCRARQTREFQGIESLCLDSHVSVYGRGETFTFGSASGLQLCIYNKSKQARATDKGDYWHSVWGARNFDEEDLFFNPAETVWRFEFRFHHSVVQQFADGSKNYETGEIINTRTYADLCPHLDGLWRYACGAFRLLSRPGVFDPFWTLITEDVRVQVESAPLLDNIEYRRYYKTAQGFSGKSCEMFLGQFVSLVARERLSAKKAIRAAKTLPFWTVIEEHYEAKGVSARDLERHISRLLSDRYLKRGFAI